MAGKSLTFLLFHWRFYKRNLVLPYGVSYAKLAYKAHPKWDDKLGKVCVSLGLTSELDLNPNVNPPPTYTKCTSRPVFPLPLEFNIPHVERVSFL